MTKYKGYKIRFFVTLFILLAFFSRPYNSYTQTSGVKTSYKRYSILSYNDEDVLCEPYIVNKDDWLYKIFRKKGEISEKDFPHFLFIFKAFNPQISNIDAIEPGIHILIPLKKVNKTDYALNSSENVDVPVIEFSSLAEDLDLQPYLKRHRLLQGDTVSKLIDKEFLNKNGSLSEEGLKAFQLANPDIKNIDIVYEGVDINLPDPSIRSQSWFQSLLSEPQSSNGPIKSSSKAKEVQEQMEAYELAQLKKYCSLIGGVLLNQGKMYFPADDNPQVIDLAVTPVIETKDGSKILIISEDLMGDELQKKIQNYWNQLKIQLMSEALENTENVDPDIFLENTTARNKELIQALLSQMDYTFQMAAKIPFSLHHLELEASFGRINRENGKDLLINFGDVYGEALAIIEKQSFDILSITPDLSSKDVIEALFSALDYATLPNPTFSTGQTIEKIYGIYAFKEKDKLFVPTRKLSINELNFMKKEGIRIISPDHNHSQPGNTDNDN